MTVNQLIVYLTNLQASGLGDVLVVLDDNVEKPEEGIEYIDLASVFYATR